ncbi:MAG: PBSX family phage terminase large subunit [Clostridia bacterium]|nr:PBSX family phage terminase large subunit [Clostridia bacterium]
MKMSKKQRAFWQNANHRWNIKEGATRSGKTYLDYYLIAKRIIKSRGEGLLVLIGNTSGTLERNILSPMREIWGEGQVGTIKNNGKLELFGKNCFALGADKANQKEKLQGMGIEYCYGDEITTWNKEVFEMLKSRLDKPHSIFDGTCNPEGPSHWFLEFLQSDADVFRQSYTIYDNPFLTPEFVKNLEKEYEGTVYFDRYILGKWTRAEGLVYPMFSKEKHTFSKIPDKGDMYISIDYGTINPTSMGLWCVKDATAYRIGEYYHDSRKSGKQLTDSEYYEKLKKLADGRNIRYVVIDPSAASFITLIRQKGEFTVIKAKNNVTDGIRYTAGLINAGRVLIHKSCRDTLREFGMYSWDDKSSGDTVIKENDHAMDEVRYFANTIMKRYYD